MVCPKCGKELKDDVRFCDGCGAQVADVQQATPVTHDVPKCTCCGHVAPWVVGPLFRPMDIICGVLFMILGVFPGLIYLATIAVIRSNKNNREKTCAKCKAKNLFTFIY